MVCAVEGCDLFARVKGWCGRHYAQARATGDPIARVRPTYGSKRRVADNGYVYLYEPTHSLAHADGYVAEHRKVAWDAGILTDPTDHVHHVDHDKQNNSLANLEVLSNAEHGRRHLAENGYVRNQFGEWPLRAS